jgi:hypothetical protein
MSDDHELFSTDESDKVINPTAEIADIPRFGENIIARWNFENWEPDHLHWNVPSNFVMFNDGELRFFAKRLSNQRRTGWPESGRRFYATLEFKFYKKSDDARPFYTYELPVVRLDWKTRVDDYQKTLALPQLVPYFTHSFSTVTRHWRTDSNEAPPIVIPFPTIEF